MIRNWIPTSRTEVTVELREVVESGVDIWDFDYPSYYKGDEKKAFEQKVLDHFWLRQIGAETVGRFLHYFRRTMREVMPYYIQRYKSVDLMDDPEIRPLDNYNMIEELTVTETDETKRTGTTGSETTTSETSQGTGEGSETVINSGKHTTVHSETPEGRLMMAVSDTGGVDSLDYASDISQVIDRDSSDRESSTSENASSTGTAKTSGDHEESETRTGGTSHHLTRRGNIGVTTYAQLLEGYRQTFLNIDMEVIKELEPCFLEVY